MYALFALMIGLCTWAFVRSRHEDPFGYAALITLLLGIAFSIRFRFMATVDEEKLTSRGFLVTRSVNWAEITKVIALGQPGVGRGIYGPFVYRFVGESQSVTINFKLFSRECYQVIFAEIGRRGVTIFDAEGRQVNGLCDSLPVVRSD